MAATLAMIETEIAAMLDVADDELTEDQKLAMDAYLAELGQAESDKVDAFAGFIKMQTARAKAIKEESQRLASRARAIENKLASMKEHYQFILTQHDLKKISGKVYQISLRPSKSVCVDNIDALPEEYRKVTVEARKSEIKKALESGQVIAGCSIVEKESLSIR